MGDRGKGKRASDGSRGKVREGNSPKEKIPEKVKKLAEEREKKRKEKKWKEADEIRKKIENSGYYIEDTKKGFKIKKYGR